MTQSADHRPAPESLDYEQARAELIDTVRRLEAGAAPLEESLALWERGEALADRCADVLDGAQARLDARVAAVSGPVDASEDGAGAGQRAEQPAGQDSHTRDAGDE